MDIFKLKKLEPLVESAAGDLKKAAENTTSIVMLSVAAVIVAVVAVVIAIVR